LPSGKIISTGDNNNDTTSITASERSMSSGASPFSTPKPTLTSRFPPRPPNSSSSLKRDISDGSGSIHSSIGGGGVNNTKSSYYSIGAKLMGTVALADLCSRTVETSSTSVISDKESTVVPPPPLPLTTTPPVNTPKVSNNSVKDEIKSTPFDLDFNIEKSESTDSHGFPKDNNINNDDIVRVDTINTESSWNTETGTFSFEDKFGGEEQQQNSTVTSPVDSVQQQSPAASSFETPESASGQKRRMTMFGSEYAKILSTSKPLSTGYNHTSQTTSSASKVKNKLKARFGSSSSKSSVVSQSSYTINNNSSTPPNKESVESGGSVLLTLDESPNSVATAAITDVIVTSGSDIPPRGYYRAFLLGEESTKNMVPGRKRQRLYLNVKKEQSWDRAAQRPCVTALCIIYPDRNEFVPPGFSVVRIVKEGDKEKGKSSTPAKSSSDQSVSPAANINVSSSGGERVYICYRRSREGNPITGITCLRPTRGDIIPDGYTVLERTPRNFLADLAAKSDQPIFLAYRQRLENLECLRPLPLVLSVLHSRPDAGRKELKAYYCTGGTVVSSDVGKYHIMDRTTHTLMSSSSAQSRLNLIQSSRKESETAVPAWVGSSSTHSGSNNRASQSASSSVASPSDELHSFDSIDDDFSRSPSQTSLVSSNSGSQYSPLIKNTTPDALFSHSDDTLQTTLDSMHFIPSIECAKSCMELDNEGTQLQSILQSRVATITPILTSCYTAQGGSSLMAIEGFISLLNETSFFAHDVTDDDNDVNNVGDISANRLTLLDLSIQVVCDVATTTARETYFRSCVDFVSDAVRHSGGRLNDRTIGYVLRFYLFVFYFGASVPTNAWPFNKSTSGGSISDDFLLSDDMEQNIHGGAPQAAAIALKEFVGILLTQSGDMSLSEMVQCHSLEAAQHYTQLASYQIHRSGGSELFWHDMLYSIGNGLFGQDVTLSPTSNQSIIHSNTIAFAILASFVKICSGKVRMIFNNTEPVPRDVASKLLSFELLSHFLDQWHVAVSSVEGTSGPTSVVKAIVIGNNDDGTESIPTMVYAIRRLVPTLLLSNTSAAIEDCRVYRRVLRIISQLWCNPLYRRNMRNELAVLIENFVLKVICLGPQVRDSRDDGSISKSDMPSLFYQQLDVLDELKRWFSNPKDTIDLFVNYNNQGDDMLLPLTYCKLMNKICEALSNLTEQCGTIICEGQVSSINGENSSPRRSASVNHSENDSVMNVRESAQCLREKAFGALTAIAKSIMDCVATQQELNDRQSDVADAMNDSDMDESLERNISLGIGLSPKLSPIKPAKSFEDDNIVDYWQKIEKRKTTLLQPLLRPPSYDLASPISFGINNSMSEEGGRQLSQTSTSKQESYDKAFEIIAGESLKKGIDYLIASRLLTSSERHISAFLRIHQSSIDDGILGEYLGEGGVDGDDIDFFNLIRFNFTRATSFVGMNIEQAIRHYLTNCGFRLPGEAQRIDRIISTFSQCYWEDNAGDLHKCPFPDQDTVFLVSFAIIMLNTDLHKSRTNASKGKAPKRMTKNEFITNLRGVCQVDKFRDYISMIYDSIEASPIAISNHSSGQDESKQDHGSSSPSLPFKGQEDLATCMQRWVKSVKPAQEFIRTVAVRNDNFITVAEPLQLEETTCQLFSSIWHLIHAAINATIDNAHLDRSALSCCLDVLEYSLCAASYLGMTVERSAFSKLLGRVNRFNDLKVPKKDGSKEKKESSNKPSKKELDFQDINQVRSLTKQLHLSLVVDNKKMGLMKHVASRIRNGDILLNDPSRIFIREGDLIKRHQAGRSSTYRFFLFSDVLVYAHKSSQGDYKVHEELPLHLMKVEDGGRGKTTDGFYIHHPSKSFFVVAASLGEKQQWIYDINESIQLEVKRKAKVEKSRMDVARRAKD